MRRSIAFIGLAGLLVSLASCADRGAVSVPTPEASAGNWVVALTVPGQAAEPGTIVEIMGTARGETSGMALGSFRAQLGYDPRKLTFISAEGGARGALAINDAGGRIRLAGAAGAGFGDGRLFTLRFRVTGRNPYAGITLALLEANGSDFVTVMPHLTVAPAVQLVPTAP